MVGVEIRTKGDTRHWATHFVTGGPQRDRVPWHAVMTHLASHAGYDVDAVWDALDAVVAEGRLGYGEDEREFLILE